MFFICFAILVGLLALVAAALGIAAITCGWVLPKARPSVERPRLYGWGVLLMALGMCLMAVAMEVFTDPIQGLGRPAGFLALLLGSRVIRASRRPQVAELQDLAKF